MIKTINLNGSEIKVTELGGDNTEIFNNSSEIVYASKLPDITAGGDEVIAIPPGAIDGLYGTRGTVYLLGVGGVELRGVDHRVTKTRVQTVSGEGTGVSASYVDEKCSETLDKANIYADVKFSEVDASVKKYADSLNLELEGYIGYTDSDIYGLEADFENCVFTRLAGAVGKNPGTDFDSVNAYGGRRRCNLSDDGEVLAYYGDDNFKANGSNGQVMVEQPKFYYRVVPLKTEKIDGADGYHLRKARYYISDTPKKGFKVHPAFVRDGAEVDKIYLSAFEGCIYDNSAGTYLLDDEQIADFDNDRLSSIAEAKPCSGEKQLLTLRNAGKLANNRGNGWQQSTIQYVSATQILMIIEYATFNFQNTLGMGVVSKSSSGVGNNSEKTGYTLALGNLSGTVDNQSISYRGEENIYGNMWTWVDGLSIHNPLTFGNGDYGQIFISEYGSEPDTSTKTRIYTCYGEGYISAFGYSEKCDWVFIHTEHNGNDILPVGDYVWNKSSGSVVATLGGNWMRNKRAGGFYWDFCYGATSHREYLGARLAYFPIGKDSSLK